MMSRRSISLAAPTVLSLFLLLGVTAANADGSIFHGMGGGGAQEFFADPPCKLKQFPDLEVLVPIPSIIDPFEEDLVQIFCQVTVQKNNQPVKKARGNFESELVIIDNNTGFTERIPLGDGSFKTNAAGFDVFDFEIPTPIFADGFESGDVSAWSYTRTSFKKKKKADTGVVACFAGTP